MMKYKNTNLTWFSMLLTLIFITLKLTGYIGWSWWLVVAPLWIIQVSFLTLAIIIFCMVFILEITGFIK